MGKGLPSKAFAVFILCSAASSQAMATPDFSSSQPINSRGSGGTPQAAVTTTTAVVSFHPCESSPITYCPATVYTLVNGLWIEAGHLSPAANEAAPGSIALTGGLEDGFGSSVAVSSDGNTVFVGNPLAPCSGDATMQCGVVDIYVKPAGGWQSMTPTAQLTVSTAARTFLGGRMLVNGTTLFVIGGTSCAALGGFCGVVYVFDQPGGGWGATAPAATLTATDGFGLKGGALAYDATASTLAVNFGAAETYVFQGSAGNFTTGGPTGTLGSGEGGDALTISGGLVVAGAPGSSGNAGGDAFVWVEPAGGWQDMSIWTADLSPQFINPRQELRLGVGVLIDGTTIYVSSANAGIYVYTEPAGGWASETENSQIGTGGTDLLAGGPMTQLGTSVVEQPTACSNLSSPCIPARIYPAPADASEGSAPILSPGSISVLNAQTSSSSIPVVLAGAQAKFEFDVGNLGQIPAQGLTLSFAPPAGTTGFSSDSGACTAGATTTCPGGSVNAGAVSAIDLTFTPPAKRTIFTISATLATTSVNWDPLDNQASIQAISDNPPVSPSSINLSSNNGATINARVLATDADGDTLTFSQDTSPIHGNLTFSSNGSYTYAPSSTTFVGNDAFAYSVSDGLLNTGGTVFIALNQPTTPPTGGGPPGGGSSGKGGGGGLGVLPFGMLVLLWRRRIVRRDRA